MTLLARVAMRAATSSKHAPGQEHAIWATHTVAAIDLVCSDRQRRCEYKGEIELWTRNVPRARHRGPSTAGTATAASINGRMAIGRGAIMFSFNPTGKPDRLYMYRKTRGKRTPYAGAPGS